MTVAIVLLAPVAIVNLGGFLLPVLNLARTSLRGVTPTGAMLDTYTMANWLAAVQDRFSFELIANSMVVSLAITLITLVTSYPIALYIYRSRGVWRTVLLVFVVSPLLTSAVVRTYGWIAILSDQGLVNNALAFFGMQRRRMMFDMSGVVIGLTEILMPYMILALTAGFGRLDVKLEEAARSLGATPLKTFWRIVFPLTLPGVALGCLLCFVLAVSSFVTPKLLGGGRVFLLATEIYDQAMVTLNWPLAATLSLLILVIFGAALAAYSRATARFA